VEIAGQLAQEAVGQTNCFFKRKTNKQSCENKNKKKDFLFGILPAKMTAIERQSEKIKDRRKYVRLQRELLRVRENESVKSCHCPLQIHKHKKFQPKRSGL
jgi:hypothetical protein